MVKEETAEKDKVAEFVGTGGFEALIEEEVDNGILESQSDIGISRVGLYLP